jgi:replication-associated recombination protein RarA
MSVRSLSSMLEGGEDPLYIARRLVVVASEDVGLADPHGLPLVGLSARKETTRCYLLIPLSMAIRQWQLIKLAK